LKFKSTKLITEMLEANMRMSIDTDVMDSGERKGGNNNNVPSLKLPGANDNSAL